MTTTLLDALGCSYDVGQTVTLKVAANDYDPLAGSGAVMEKAYTLCGVLPAYDVYWNLNGNLTVSGIVAEPLAIDGQKFQTFYYLNAAAPVTASTDPALVAKRVCPPAGGYRLVLPALLLVAAILVSFGGAVFPDRSAQAYIPHQYLPHFGGLKPGFPAYACGKHFAGLAAVAAGFALVAVLRQSVWGRRSTFRS